MFILPCVSRDLVEDADIDPSAGDAMLVNAPSCLGYDWDDKRFNKVYRLWGNKTQGRPYHLYLLAVAALIEARLGKKAFTDGDITRGQFRKAVEIANMVLDKPIDLPDRCNMERLYKRVTELPLEPVEQMTIFKKTYLGVKDQEFGNYLRQNFPEDVIKAYWEKEFKDCKIGSIGFNSMIGEYLLWGFGLRELCDYVNFKSENEEKQYRDFVKCIMDAKLHIKDKNCEDILNIDPERESPYGVEWLFAQFMFAGVHNKKVDRYIPIEEIKSALIEGLGSKCETEKIIDDYLKEEAKKSDFMLNRELSVKDVELAIEQDPAEAFMQTMNLNSEQLDEIKEKYDISESDHLLYYKEGNKIKPSIEKSFAYLMNFLEGVLEEEEYTEFLNDSAKARCKCIVDRNKYILIRDTDWDKIFTDIEKNKSSFGRYYSLIRIKMDTNELVDMCKALMINDELYEYGKKLVNKGDNKS